jgi:PIN domain nuclease of toxin-antitoxin system
MKTSFLIDTHIFLWILGGRKLSNKAKTFFFERESGSFFLSDASAWEISIKYGAGKLELPDIPEIFVPDRIRRAGMSHLPIDLRHVLKAHSLPPIHKDPFDRLLVCQAKVEGLTILTADDIFTKYTDDVINFADIS